MYNPTLNKRKLKEYLNGALIIAEENAIIEYPFKYATVKPRSFTQNTASIPIQYYAVTETIFTSNTDLSVGKNSSIRMHDRSILTVENIEEERNEIGRLTGLFIYLNGGKPNG